MFKLNEDASNIGLHIGFMIKFFEFMGIESAEKKVTPKQFEGIRKWSEDNPDKGSILEGEGRCNFFFVNRVETILIIFYQEIDEPEQITLNKIFKKD